MALVKNETKKYVCDFCKLECEPVRSFRYTHSMTPDNNKNEIVFNVGGRIPFVTDTPDVCTTCSRKAAEYILEMTAAV